MVTLRSFVAASALVVMSAAACGTGAEPSEAQPERRAVVAASAATRDELGVATWEITPQDRAGSFRIQGYDATHSPTISVDEGVSLEQTATPRFAFTVRHGTAAARMKMLFTKDANTGADIAVFVEDSFTTDTTAQHIVERLLGDVEAAKPGDVGGESPGLTTTKLHPTDFGDLVGDVWDGLTCSGKCGWKLIQVGGTGLLTLTNCAGAVVAATDTVACTTVAAPTVAGAAACLAVGGAATAAGGWACYYLGGKTIDRGREVDDSCTCESD